MLYYLSLKKTSSLDFYKDNTPIVIPFLGVAIFPFLGSDWPASTFLLLFFRNFPATRLELSRDVAFNTNQSEERKNKYVGRSSPQNASHHRETSTAFMLGINPMDTYF